MEEFNNQNHKHKHDKEPKEIKPTSIKTDRIQKQLGRIDRKARKPIPQDLNPFKAHTHKWLTYHVGNVIELDNINENMIEYYGQGVQMHMDNAQANNMHII